MNKSIRPLSFLMICTLTVQCATPQPGVLLDSPNVQISCEYVGQGRLINETEVECIMVNHAATPARILFKQVSLEDPHAEIEPIDRQKIRVGDAVETIVVILGVIIIVGVVIALISKSKGHSVDVPLIHFGPFDPEIHSSDIPQRTLIADTFEIPGNNSVQLLFLAKHGKQRPQVLAIRLGNNPQELIKVPIHASPGAARINPP